MKMDTDTLAKELQYLATSEVEAEIARGMQVLWLLFNINFWYELNILPEVRKKFAPNFTFVTLTIPIRQDLQEEREERLREARRHIRQSSFVWQLSMTQFMFMKPNSDVPLKGFSYHFPDDTGLFRSSTREWTHFAPWNNDKSMDKGTPQEERLYILLASEKLVRRV